MHRPLAPTTAPRRQRRHSLRPHLAHPHLRPRLFNPHRNNTPPPPLLTTDRTSSPGIVMRAFGNDCLRCVIAWTIKALGLICSTRQRLRILTYPTNQKRLQRMYNIHPGTPLLSYGRQVEDSIRKAASKHGPNARFATTSGSTGKPKQILYTRRRLLSLKLTFSD